MKRYLITTGAAVLAGAVLASSPAGAKTFTGVTAPGGTWGKAEEVPGTAVLNAGGSAEIYSVSCASAGNCSAGGDYAGKSGSILPFVVSQVNGVWGKAERVPGLAALNTGSDASIADVSCASAGNCSAAGEYTQKSGRTQGFVVSQVNGVWGKAEGIPGLPSLNTYGRLSTDSVSCASAGNCSADG